MILNKVIEFKNVSHSYAQKIVLKDIDFKFPAGQCQIVLGPSGSGKSTILKLIAGLESPTSGDIKRPNSYGYVLQEGGLFPHLDIFENIAIQGFALKWPSKNIASRVHELCELTQFPQDLLRSHPNQVSGGQKQRAALMRALFLDPQVLLLDESLSALDPLLKFDLMRDLKSILSNLKKTAVLVTHDLMEASVLGDRILLLNEGSVEEFASRSDFFQRPQSAFAKRFIQSQKVSTDQ